MSRQKTKKIIDLMNQLYCFDNKQVENYKNQIFHMPEEGLNELIKTLEAGLKEQEEMITTWIKREPEFAKKLVTFVDKTVRQLSREYEKTEKSSAEGILAELE